MNETSKKIEELRGEIEKLKREIYELEKVNSNYYIGVRYIGDGDCWDEYYHRIGYITESDAKDWVEESLHNVNVYRSDYFAVTADVYNKYDDWYHLNELYDSIDVYNTEIGKLEGVDDFKETVRVALHRVTKELGIEYLSFMHPGEDE